MLNMFFLTKQSHPNDVEHLAVPGSFLTALRRKKVESKENEKYKQFSIKYFLSFTENTVNQM